MKTILNTPMAAHGLCKASPRELRTQDVKPRFMALLVPTHRIADRHANRGQICPTMAVRQVLGYRTDEIRTLFLATVSFLAGSVPAALHTRERTRSPRKAFLFHLSGTRGLA